MARGGDTLPLVQCSLEQVRDAIAREDKAYDFNILFWRSILQEEPDALFMPLRNRTLSFWIQTYNKWQDIRRKQQLKDSNVNGTHLGQVLYATQSTQRGVIGLFDPEGALSISANGPSLSTMNKVKISMLELLAAGVLLTQLVSNVNKMTFLFGLADLEDDGALDEKQFTMVLWAFTNGLGRAFKVAAKSLPTREGVRKIATRLYSRIRDCGSREVNCNGQLSFSALADWLCGKTSDIDPLALPYRLAIDRFCGSSSVARDEFDIHVAAFRLSHSAPVPVPQCEKTQLMTRPFVVLAKDVYVECKSCGREQLKVGDLEPLLERWGSRIEINEQLKLVQGYNAMVRDITKRRSRLQDSTFIDFLQKLCPAADPCQIRMFLSWTLENKEYLKLQKEASKLDAVVGDFMDAQSKPVLPEDEIRTILEEFDRIDCSGDGLLTMHEICMEWGWSNDDARKCVSYDTSSDGFIDKEEFLRMMCPPEYRLPEMSGSDRDIFGKMLVFAASERRQAVEAEKAKLKGQGGGELSVPTSALPLADPDMMRQWTNMFKRFDPDGDGMVTIQELMQSGLLVQGEVEAVASLIDPDDVDRFSEDSFLAVMCRIHQVRPPQQEMARKANMRRSDVAGKGLRGNVHANVDVSTEQGTGTYKDRLQAIFRKYDSDGSGKISKDELAQILRATGSSISDKDIDAMFRVMDVNKDGGVDYTEFVGWLYAAGA